jgi:hypothetical protein
MVGLRLEGKHPMVIRNGAASRVWKGNRMAIIESVKAFWVRFSQFAQAMEYDSDVDLRQRVERLEQRVYRNSIDSRELNSEDLAAAKADFASKQVMNHD